VKVEVDIDYSEYTLYGSDYGVTLSHHGCEKDAEGKLGFWECDDGASVQVFTQTVVDHHMKWHYHE